MSVCETFAWHAALALLAEVGLGADKVTCNSAISACGRASEWQQALGLLELMEKKLLEADTISCNSAISACEKAGKWQEALSILQQAWRGKCGSETFGFSYPFANQAWQ